MGAHLNKTSNLDSVNEALGNSSARRTGQGKRLPPTQEALLQHTRSQSTNGIWQPVINVSRSPNPRVLWMDSRECKRRPGVLGGPNLPEASKRLRELVSVAAKAPRAETMLMQRRRSGSAQPNYAAANSWSYRFGAGYIIAGP
ncbi:hypothetical protein GWK47_024523 [Chionoecetes opilio]|uniref:Uncharacterized protein n=1 Tax=Chionoecetes opilio TaxID=41210 RepID=A0A8J4XLJ5_CHIOP|nr:hypothetical protein GWK47_024523 [Chionoecetes opilio]